MEACTFIASGKIRKKGRRVKWGSKA